MTHWIHGRMIYTSGSHSHSTVPAPANGVTSPVSTFPLNCAGADPKLFTKLVSSVHGIYESIIANDDRTTRIVLPFASDHDRVGLVAGHRTFEHFIPFDQNRAAIRNVDQDARRAQGTVCDLAVDDFGDGGTRFNVVAFVLPEEFRAFNS